MSIGGDSIGRDAIGGFTSPIQRVTYNPLSRPTGDFTSLLFKSRADYIQPQGEDMPAKFAIAGLLFTTVTISTGSADDVPIDNEYRDPDNILTIAANACTLAASPSGWYDVTLIVNLEVNGGAPVSGDGYFLIRMTNDSGLGDNLVVRVPTPAGLAVDFNDYSITQPIYFTSNTFGVRITNQTGHDLDAYLVSVCFTQK